MSKKILGLLLAICLVVGLLPAMASADGENLATPYTLKMGYASFKLTKYDTPIYIKNGTVDTFDTQSNAFTAYVPTTSGASASNWTAKLEWKTGEAGPTLTLNGFKYDEFNDATNYWRYRGEGYDLTDHAQTTAITAPATAPLTIVITGADSLIETKFGIPFNNDLTIKSEGAAKLTMNNMSGGINGASGKSLTINANLDVNVASYYSSTMMVVGTTAADININGGNVNLTGTTSLVALRTATSGNININGGTVYAKGGHRGATTANADDHININGGSATIVGSYSAVYKADVKSTPTIPANADVEIMTGSKTDGSNAAVRDAIASACYVKVTYNTPAPTETTAPATETTAPTTTTAPSTTTAPTAAPTDAPTAAPTDAPTTAPTGGALAEKVTVKFGFTKLEMTKYDTPIYYKNASKVVKDTAGNDFTYWYPVAGDADNWNAKLEWKTGEAAPTLTLNGFKMDDWNNETEKMRAKDQENPSDGGVQTYAIATPSNVPLTIVLTGEDSMIECSFGITCYNSLTIKSEGTAKLTMSNSNSCITTVEKEGATVTIDANLDLFKRGYYNTKHGLALIQTYKADLIINGGTIKVNTSMEKQVSGIAARDGGNVIINGGTITARGVAGQSPTNGSITATAGKVIINGGTVNATALAAVPVYAAKGIEINGGEVNITSPYYGMNAGKDEAPADVKINGGKVTIISANGAFYGKAPILGAGVDGIAGPNEDEADFYDETKYRATWVQLTYTAPSGSTPSNPSNPGGSPTPSTPSAPSGTTPGGTVNPGTGDSGVTMFVVMMLIGVFGIVATVTFSKKRAV